MTQNDWRPVAIALTCSWPSQVNSWGDEIVAGYCSRLEHLGVTPDQALTAIDSCDANQTHPPSVPELAGLARKDPSAPTFDEVLRALYGNGRGGVIGLLWSCPGDRGMPAAVDRLAGEHKLVQDFARAVGSDWLRSLDPLGDGQYAGVDRKKLEHSWREFLGRHDERDVAALAAGRRNGRLRSVDPARQIGGAS